MKVFLGGTCNGSAWRRDLIPFLNNAEIDYFNPVVDDWTEECKAEEIRQRQECDFCLYVITPSMTGVYSIAEVIDDSNKRPERTLFWYVSDFFPLVKNFSEGQRRSLRSVAEMVENNGGKAFSEDDSFSDIVKYLKEQKSEKN